LFRNLGGCAASDDVPKALHYTVLFALMVLLVVMVVYQVIQLLLNFQTMWMELEKNRAAEAANRSRKSSSKNVRIEPLEKIREWLLEIHRWKREKTQWAKLRLWHEKALCIALVLFFPVYIILLGLIQVMSSKQILLYLYSAWICIPDTLPSFMYNFATTVYIGFPWMCLHPNNHILYRAALVLLLLSWALPLLFALYLAILPLCFLGTLVYLPLKSLGSARKHKVSHLSISAHSLRAGKVAMQIESCTVERDGIPKKTTLCITKQLQFRFGECTALMGPSGAGKTTLMDVLQRKVNATGKVTYPAFFNSEEIEWSDWSFCRRKHIGFVPQDDNLFKDLTVLENLHCFLSSRRPVSTLCVGRFF